MPPNEKEVKLSNGSTLKFLSSNTGDIKSLEKDFTVNATITVNVSVEVSAESSEDAKERAKYSIYNGCYECKDLENDPVINWAEPQND